jgi:ABC-type multidrug transport system fused ATPase/permease subunit
MLLKDYCFIQVIVFIKKGNIEKEEKVEKEETLNWPNRGEIIFDGFELKYREDLPNVLNGITLKINPGESIGVVGRTGAGKGSTKRRKIINDVSFV